jgi:hypothetical protein
MPVAKDVFAGCDGVANMIPRERRCPNNRNEINIRMGDELFRKPNLTPKSVGLRMI